MIIRSTFLAVLVACLHAMALTASPKELDRYNVVWNSPSKNAAGSMPIGNGEVGLNVWVEEGGDLLFYIARTDAWSESSRLLKLGRVRVSLSPNPFTNAAAFRQELKLRDGLIQIIAGAREERVSLKLFVDANAPVIHLVGESQRPMSVKASLEVWRTEKKLLKGAEAQSSWTMQDAPIGVDVSESADIVRDTPDAITWFHRNEHSVVPFTLHFQGLDSVTQFASDPLLHRTFGGRISGPGFMKGSPTTLHTKSTAKTFTLTITTHTAQTKSVGEWEQQLLSAKSAKPEAAAKQTAKWWNEFWDRSWIFVDHKGSAASLPQSQHPVRIGIDAAGGNRFRGAFGRASIFNRALSQKEVEALSLGDPDKALPFTNNLVASWNLNDAAASTISSRAGNSITATRAKDAFELPRDPRLALTNAFTLEAWIQPSVATPARIFDSMTPGGSDGFLFDTHPGRHLRLIVGPDTIDAQNVLTAGKWQHVVAVADAKSGTRAIYLNGKFVQGTGGSTHADSEPPSKITQSYILQRWMNACGGRGNYPIKFNGSIFTVEPQFTDASVNFNADWRRWGDCYWWQNTRFPGYASIASGDYGVCEPLFRMYRDVTPLCRARAKLYYDADGVYFPETMTLFGTYANKDYGWNRKDRAANEIDCRYWRFAWQQGLELVMLMLDYYAHTDDAKFLDEQLLPMSRDVLRYFDSRFKRDAQGKLVISPTQSAETYWDNVVNDTPTIAGLHAVLDRLLALSKASRADREFWSALKGATPDLPLTTSGGVTIIPPAQSFSPRRYNCENTELYAMWPFRNVGIHTTNTAIGVETFARRKERIIKGWCYDGPSAAILGITEHAKKELEIRARNTHPNHRFPAMWGPNFDWVPDQDHGGNIMLTLQHMLLTSDGDKIFLMPAWPKDWNVRFKLHAPHRTTVEAEYRNGKLAGYKVIPKSRTKDVVIMAP